MEYLYSWTNKALEQNLRDLFRACGKEIQGYYTRQCFCIQGSTPQNENRKNDIQDNEKSLHTTQD